MFAKLENQKDYIQSTNKDYFLNPYFNNHNHDGQQTLQDILVQESIQSRGIELVYLERDQANLDLLYGEDPQNEFNNAKKFVAYLESFDGYQGQNEFFQKFGMSVNDEITLQINPNLFNQQTGTFPKEGDLLYFPMDKALFEITWCTPRDQFYQNGVLQIQKIQAQKFIYSHEKIDPKLQNTEISSDMYNLDLNELTKFESDDLESLFGLSEQLEKSTDVYKDQLKEDKFIKKSFEKIDIDTSPVNGQTSEDIEFLDEDY